MSRSGIGFLDAAPQAPRTQEPRMERTRLSRERRRERGLEGTRPSRGEGRQGRGLGCRYGAHGPRARGGGSLVAAGQEGDGMGRLQEGGQGGEVDAQEVHGD
jgi:hypothetical protein